LSTPHVFSNLIFLGEHGWGF